MGPPSPHIQLTLEAAKLKREAEGPPRSPARRWRDKKLDIDVSAAAGTVRSHQRAASNATTPQPQTPSVSVLAASFGHASLQS